MQSSLQDLFVLQQWDAISASWQQEERKLLCLLCFLIFLLSFQSQSVTKTYSSTSKTSAAFRAVNASEIGYRAPRRTPVGPAAVRCNFSIRTAGGGIQRAGNAQLLLQREIRAILNRKTAFLYLLTTQLLNSRRCPCQQCLMEGPMFILFSSEVFSIQTSFGKFSLFSFNFLAFCNNLLFLTSSWVTGWDSLQKGKCPLKLCQFFWDVDFSWCSLIASHCHFSLSGLAAVRKWFCAQTKYKDLKGKSVCVVVLFWWGFFCLFF